MIKTKNIFTTGLVLSLALCSFNSMANPFSTESVNEYQSLNLDEEDEDKEKEKDKKDSTVRGIGSYSIDTIDKYVILDDTLIYEDFDIIEMVAPVVDAVQNIQYDKTPKLIQGCGLSCFARQADKAQPLVDNTKDIIPVAEPSLFPNPARVSDIITIETGTVNPSTVQVIDMNGKIVELTQNVSEKHELTGYVSGTYFVLIISEDGAVKHKKLLVM
jgi:hypothetical protein